MNTFHYTYGHEHEALQNIAEQHGVNLNGKVHECRLYSVAKGLRKRIARSTHIIRVDKLQTFASQRQDDRKRFRGVNGRHLCADYYTRFRTRWPLQTGTFSMVAGRAKICQFKVVY